MAVIKVGKAFYFLRIVNIKLTSIANPCINGYRIYVDIMTGEKLSFRLLTRTSFIGQFVLPVGGDDIDGGIVILAATSFTLLRICT